MSSGSERFKQVFNQMLRNKEHGSIAKYWRQRYLDAAKANASAAELQQIVDATEDEAVDEIQWHGANASPICVFKDRSGLQMVREEDGTLTFVAYNMCNSDTFERRDKGER